jgi:iron complex outermembrane receptor protein
MAHMFRYAACVLLAAMSASFAQQPAAQDEPPRVVLPTVTVTAQKEPEDKQKLPVSVTAVSRDTIEAAGIQIVSQAAILAPNTIFTEWSARKLSNARFRGISSSPNNPGITTYIDGVPQLSANSSSIDLLDVDQIEFVRGAQSALFGRNTLGGLVNVTSRRPSLSKWSGALSVPFGTYGSWGVRGGVSGPIAGNTLSVGVSFAKMEREGFTVNDVTGQPIDDRSGFSTKAQLLWTPTSAWETRVIFTSERARDGDYSLNDVAALRARPFHAARDFVGRADRDILATTIQTRHNGRRVVISSTTGFLDWRTQDVTDLDSTPRALITRDNEENDFQFTQEIRFASADAAPVSLGASTTLSWQGGLFLFTQGYTQDAINSYAPFVFAPFPVSEHSPRSALDDAGVGVFGQATFTLNRRLDLIAGARIDRENKKASLENFFEPAVAPPFSASREKSFSNVSPQGAVAYRLTPDRTLYGTVTCGYKAGGFNSASPAGREAYGEEHALHVEGGVKTLWASGRVSTNAAVYYINWDDLQLNIPNPAVPAQFFISNVGGAVSKGLELEVNARAAEHVDVFTSVGYSHARFGEGSVSGVRSIEGNRLPSTPDYTASAGVQYSRTIRPGTAVSTRGEVVFYGSFTYNDANTLGQDAYSLANFRAALTTRLFIADVFVRNAFDTRYMPLAFSYPSFAPSGFVGEMGAPRTAGVSLGVRF